MTKAEPIAVIGIGCRFPGASDLQSFSQMLVEGRNCRTRVPPARYHAEAYYHPDQNSPGTSVTKDAHFLSQDVSLFDAPFFSINPNEANAMDPQQRFLLEVTYEALQDAGLSIGKMQGSDTSCFVGAFTTDFRDNMVKDIEALSEYSGAGCSNALLSNRISWFYGLHGPSMTVDTACSSSLSAVHLACQSLITGESQSSIVGGANLMLGPHSAVAMSSAHLLSPDGTSYSFDHRANGYGRGEGVGVLVLKRLSDALASGDTIRAVIRSTFSNQDGRTAGIAQPSSEAQQSLIRSAYLKAGLDPSETGYVEAHGTGTKTGDPIEVASIVAAFDSKARSTPLLVGSVKSSIGHLEGASGIASIIKCIGILESGVIPPNPSFEKLNPRISLPEHIRVPVTAEPWPTLQTRRASVNSFGFGGANVHIVLEDALHFLESHSLDGYHATAANPVFEWPACRQSIRSSSGVSVARAVLDDSTARHFLIPLSSHDKNGVARGASQLASVINNHKVGSPVSGALMEALANTLADRAEHPWKAFIVGSTLDEVAKSLEQVQSPIRASPFPQVAFVFTGQGAQWWAMGRELHAYPAYRESIRASCEYLKSLGSDWNLEDELGRDSTHSRLRKPEIGQAACTAVQVALVDLLRSVGVAPAAVIGHSSGEIAAAYAAGGISHMYATKIAYYRGLYVSRLHDHPSLNRGAMAAVELTEAEVEVYLGKLKPKAVVIGCVNSFKNCTVSGDEEAVDQLLDSWSRDGVRATKLKINVAYHSQHMREVGEQYRDALSCHNDAGGQGNGQADLAVPMVSSLTGGLVSAGSLGASYWAENLLGRVNFHMGMQTLLQHLQKTITNDSTVMLVEVGPHSSLRTPVVDEIRASATSPEQWKYACLLRRGEQSTSTFLDAIGTLFQAGISVDFARINQIRDAAIKLVNLPTYAWNHSNTHKVTSTLIHEHCSPSYPLSNLLGRAIGGSRGLFWRKIFNVKQNPWIRGHQIDSCIIAPAAWYLALAIEAARILASHDTGKPATAFELADVSFISALKIPLDGSVEVRLEICPEAAPLSPIAPLTRFGFRVSSHLQDDMAGHLHCSGFIEALLTSPTKQANILQAETNLDEESLVNQWAEMEPGCYFYEALNKCGIQLEPPFQNLFNIKSERSHGSGCVRIPAESGSSQTNVIIHPATLDGFLQLGFLPLVNVGTPPSAPLMPKTIKRLWIAASKDFLEPGYKLIGNATTVEAGSQCWDSAISAACQNHKAPRVIIEGLRISAVPDLRDVSKVNAAGEEHQLCSEVRWIPDVDFLPPSKARSHILKDVPPQSDDETKLGALAEYMSLYLPMVLEKWQGECGELAVSGHLALWLNWLTRYVHNTAAEVGSNHMKKLLEDEIRNTHAGPIWLEAVRRIGDSFNGILARKVEPLQLLLQDGLLTSLYLNGFGRCANRQAASYIDMVVANYPCASMLEIGAGTGATTASILERLGNRSSRYRYVFTDISPGFAREAADKFAAYASTMEFLTLDVERDPTEQGFKAGSFDIVIASNVLHATTSIARTLSHVHKLLRPGGKLVLLELTSNHPAVSLIMGSLPGWWLGENDGRTGGPLLTSQQWDSALRESGFTGIGLDMPGGATSSRMPLSLIVSAKKLATTEANTRISRFSIITKAERQSSPLALDLRRKLSDSKWPVSIDRFGAALPAGTFAISLLENEEPLLANITDDEFVSFQTLIHQSVGILWLTRGGMVECASPWHSLVIGLARSIRNERSGFSFGVLDIDLGGQGPRVCKAILDVALRLALEPHGDYEYAFRDGQLSIPRVMQRPDLSRIVATEVSRGNERNNSLHNDQNGKAPSRHDAQYNAPLEPDWANVKIKASQEGVSKVSREEVCGINTSMSSQHTLKTAVKLRGDASYLIAGLGGVGRSLAWWLAEQGAKTLVLVSRAAATNTDSKAWADELRRNFGNRVVAYDCDIADGDALSNMLVQVSESGLPPIAGVITGAMELQDVLFEGMTASAFRAVVRPKADGSWNLHKLLPQDLDFFVMLSSIIGVAGLRGQANYNAGNTFQDALASHRVNSGLCAMSLDLGYIPNVGYVTKDADFIRTFQTIGIEAVSEKEVHALVGIASWNASVEARDRFPPQVATGLAPCHDADAASRYYWASDARFSLLQTARVDEADTSQAVTISLQAELQAATSTTGMAKCLERAMIMQVARLMMVAVEDVVGSKSLTAHGVDSLVAIELRNWIEREVAVGMSVLDMMGNTTINELAQSLATKRIPVGGS